MPDPDLTDDIETSAEGPKKMIGDQGTAEEHPLPDQIAADRYLKSSAAQGAKGKGFGLSIARIKPPGSQ